jgi:hypothetical protein
MLTTLVVSRKANLAWDDADYLRRGLSNARFAEASGPLLIGPRAIDRLLLEQPKPPWLVAWIESGVHMIGRRNIGALILYSSVIPYTFLAAAVIFLGRRLGGQWAGFFSLLCLIASPLSLAFGGKVMVETYLALWVLLAYALTAFYLAAPSRWKAAALGLVVGLALLTKVTTALFLPGPLIYGCGAVQRNGGVRSMFLKRLALCIVVCIAVAGPWYLKNAHAAVKFALFSAKYNELATGRDRVPMPQRVAEIANDVVGWPLVVTVGGSAIAFALFGQKRREQPAIDADQAVAGRYFREMAWLGAGIAAVSLLLPAYFDTRFLLPIWPVLAVALGTGVSLQLTKLRAIPRSLIGIGFVVSIACATVAVIREPLFPTYWKTTAFIDDLVTRFGVSNLLNVGNCAGWNVCKTGLMNELRDEPGNCFVLHDLTKAADARAKQLLKQADAVVVLGRSDLSDAVLQVAPGLNRGYQGLVRSLMADPEFLLMPITATEGLPELSVFVRQNRLDQARKILKFDTVRRR